MRLLVAGNSGQVAQSLAELSSKECHITCLGRPELDLLKPETLQPAIDRTSPDVIINAAAYTAVDHAESDEAAAFAVNCDGARALAKAASSNNLPLIHISTDYVYDGRSDSPYKENDPVAPTSVYGRSKLAGEKEVRSGQPHSIIVRTAWIVSPFGKNFCKTMLRLAGEHPKLRVVSDQIGSPTYAPHLATGLIELAIAINDQRSEVDWGVYHLANGGEASWYDVAIQTMLHAEQCGLASAPVEAITTAEFPTAAQRPPNSRLNCLKAEEKFGIVLADWRSGIKACVERLAQQ